MQLVEHLQQCSLAGVVLPVRHQLVPPVTHRRVHACLLMMVMMMMMMMMMMMSCAAVTRDALRVCCSGGEVPWSIRERLAVLSCTNACVCAPKCAAYRQWHCTSPPVDAP
jgi:hypothetical protein